jgi:disulfide bond formation protein DsbB
MTPRFAVALNALALYAIALILAVAFYFQIVLGELPCPLCMLQRIAFIALAIGPILTLRFGPRPRHYAMAIIAAVLGAAIASRQILLHIGPADPGYGSALLGYHFYTWAFISFAVAVLASAVVLLFDGQFEPMSKPLKLAPLESGAIWLVLAMAVLNVASAFLECGFGACPADPVHYQLLHAAF